ncbi:transcriptional regulator [Clostridium gelidum]|uniref:Transcriptional regulator n=1 Tax=Clostridium gelidum TaxID=704125 RepID=A0ABN6IY50_9CLOT|nr:TetR-like C-terminal domain-containing protein [Clostridium gelidum]BCZ46902.1 transcriptional regulator [Clostridium gelidum]BCZ47262.1 transcriptional regulator [Clostridium gelidum]
MNTNIDSTKMHRTRQKIIKAFLDLYAKKQLEQIYIKSLTESAGINRGTFYLHYMDLEDLVTSIENEQLDALAKLDKEVNYFYYSRKDNEFAQYFKPIFNYIVENKKLFKILMSPHSHPNFRESFQRAMRNNFTQRFHSVLMTAKGKELLKKEYIIESVINGNLAMIIHWIQSDINLSPEELADLISYTVLKSPLDIIENNIK